MFVCVLTMTAGFSIVLIEDITKTKQTMADQAALVAKIIGESCISAISFNYPEKAEQNLSLISTLPGFENAQIFNEKGELFATYDKHEKIASIPSLMRLEQSRQYLSSYLHLVEPIIYNEKNYGVIYLRVRSSIDSTIRSRVIIMGVVMISLMILSYLLASLVQKIISTPILQLAHTAEKISEETDYSIRLKNTNTGEIGILFSAFNSMLSVIQQRNIDRNMAEENLRFKEQVIDSTTSCIATADMRGFITYANPSFLKLFDQLSIEEILLKSFSRFFAESEVFNSMLTSLNSHESWTFETKARKKNGACFDAIFSADTIQDASGIPISLVITVSDISELRKTSREMELENWLKSGQSVLYDQLRGEQEVNQLAANILKGLKEYINFQVGTVYVANGYRELYLAGSYALHHARQLKEICMFGQGLAGQAALDKTKILVSNLPEDYIWINSGMGKAAPRFLIAIPFIYENSVKAVLELGSFDEFGQKELELLERLKTTIAIAIHTAQSREQVQQLLEKTQIQSEELQVQTEELQSQQEELRKVNQELKDKTNVLLKSEKRLQQQQEELQQTNEELEEQRDGINKKNEELEKARSLIEKKATDLEMTSRYKSEFLANMSHELRTPLNSILLLSDVLVENRDNSLSLKHVTFAENIHASGKDLLNLINDILDLSKIESGKMEILVEDVQLDKLLANMERLFEPVSREKGIPLLIEIHEDLPMNIKSDKQKIEQILKNLLSNAFKFTSSGSVKLTIEKSKPLVKRLFPSFDPETTTIFSVADSGIGISMEKQSVIFDAFVQVDGTTSRKYGGTGLGLSISKEIAKRLGGKLNLESKPGKGSTFYLALPQISPIDQEEDLFLEEDPALPRKATPYLPPVLEKKSRTKLPVSEIKDDNALIFEDDKKLLLIIEDDPKFSSILKRVAHEEGFNTIVAEDGRTGLHFADYHNPSAIILDIALPDMDGWKILSKLKNNLSTRHIPVHIISASEKNREAMRMGAVDFLTKPVSLKKLEALFDNICKFISRPVRKLMVVEDDKVQMNAIMELIGNGDVKVTGVSTGKEAKERLLSEKYDCLILDLNLPDMPGEELLTTIRREESLLMIPVIIYTAKDLTNREKMILQESAESVIIKGVKSSERLLDETTLFLHRVDSSLSSNKREIIHRIHDQGSILEGKHILLVDDDIRNVFAISSILESNGLVLTTAKNGKEALSALKMNPSVNLVLMDMMMPEMDGYQAMIEIRNQKQFEKLPIIAITAKAMKGDRYKCIKAGANDYLAKPIDQDKLLSMMRVWLY